MTGLGKRARPTGRSSWILRSVARSIWKQFDRATLLKIHEDRPVGLALFPSPVIHAKNAYRLWGRACDRPQTTKKRGSRNEHPQRWGQPLAHLGAGSQTKCDQRLAQPIGHASIRLYQIRKPFGENLARAGGGATDKFANGQS